MEFSYSEEQLEARDLARRIFADKLSNEHLKTIESQQTNSDPALWQTLAEAGLLGLGLDEKWSGMGMGFESLCLLFEEAGRKTAPVPLIPALCSGLIVQKFADEDAKARLLPPLARGETILSMATIEPQNEELLHPQCQAYKTKAGWTLHGVKHCVPYGESASEILVTANTEPSENGSGEPGLFLITREHAEISSQISTAKEPQAMLKLDGAPAVAIAIGADKLRWAIERKNAAQCAFAVGLCEEMLRITAAYASEREQFGVKIATFQAVSHRAADCYIDIECLRLATQQAISLLEREEEAEEALQVAQIWCCNTAHRVSFSAQHLHGGIGVDRDYGLFRYCLWAKQIELALGGSARQMAALGANIANQFSKQANALRH